MATTQVAILRDSREFLNTPVAVCTPDVAARVASFAREGALASMMRVCRTWNDAAIRPLWMNMTSMLPILELAGPMAYENDCGWAYELMPTSEGWRRLMIYAPNVTCVSHDDTATYKSHDSTISPSALMGDLLLLSKITATETLFPNLLHLRLHISTALSALQAHSIMSSNMKILVLSFDPGLPVTSTRGFLSRLSFICHGGLRELTLTLNQDQLSDGLCASALRGLIDDQRTLNNASLSCPGLPPSEILSALGRHPCLQTLDLIIDTLTVNDTSNLFEGLCGFDSSMKSLKVAARFVAAKAPFEAVLPALRWRMLQDVTFVNLVMCPGADQDVDLMSTAWPSLVSLAFWATDPRITDSGMPFQRLSVILARFPRLRTLAIHACVSTQAKIPTADLLAVNLRQLAFGFSHLHQSKVREVAEYLAFVCPLGIEIGYSPPSDLFGPGVPISSISPDGTWEDVFDRLRMAHRVAQSFVQRQSMQNQLISSSQDA